MKKSHPIRHRALAVRRAHKARTLKARRQVEALAGLMGYRRALRERHLGPPMPRPFGMITEAVRQSAALASAVVQRLSAWQAVEPGALAKAGIARAPIVPE